jgi:hypothetical protein
MTCSRRSRRSHARGGRSNPCGGNRVPRSASVIAITFGIGAVIVAICAGGAHARQKPMTDAEIRELLGGEDRGKRPGAGLPRVTATALHAGFLNDDFGAGKKYAQRVFAITGRITDIGAVPRRSDGRFVAPDFGACRRRACGAYVTLEGKVQALFHPDDQTEVDSLKRGTGTTLGCLIDGMNTAATHVIATECFVMPKK